MPRRTPIHRQWKTLVCLLLASLHLSAPPARAQHAELDAIYAEYDEAFLQMRPTFATLRGDKPATTLPEASR